MPRVHICLVSDQLLPNLIPVLMERPERVYLVATEPMRTKGKDQRLKALIERQNLEVDSYAGAPSADMPAIREYALTVGTEISHAEASNTIVLNATGGTKLLSISSPRAIYPSCCLPVAKAWASRHGKSQSNRI